MISKKVRLGIWETLGCFSHKFSGPFVDYPVGKPTWAVFSCVHRLYGFADDWLSNPSWCINHKFLDGFKKGYEND